MSEQGNVIRIADWDDEPLFAPGMTVIASVKNPLENPYSTGKLRPAVLVEPVGSDWLLMGLTRKSTYGSGLPRVAVPNPNRVGLRGPGHLWGQWLTRVSVLDVSHQIGWADPQLAIAVADLAHLSPGQRRQLLRAALKHHPTPWGSPPGTAWAA